MSDVPGTLQTGSSLQLLNCHRGEATTNSAIQRFSKNETCFGFFLQEPWASKGKNPPEHPDFFQFTPTSFNNKCATYIRRSALLQPTVHTKHSNHVIAVTIHPPHQAPITLYNIYSPGLAIHAARFFENHTPQLPCIIMGDLNAHHSWWYGSESTNTSQIANTIRSSTAIVDWKDKNNFSLQNTPGVYTHFPSNGNQPSIIDLCFTSGLNASTVLVWGIDPDSASDHAICYIHLNFTIAKPILKRN